MARIINKKYIYEKNNNCYAAKLLQSLEELVKKYGFIITPFVIDWPEMDSLEGNNIFEKMRDAEKKIKTVPKTSQPSIGVCKKYLMMP